jgi:hypothetical protein
MEPSIWVAGVYSVMLYPYVSHTPSLFHMLPTNPAHAGWSFLVVPLFCMPAGIPVTAETVNYASVAFVGFIIFATAWYFAWGKTNYGGPPPVNDHLSEN